MRPRFWLLGLVPLLLGAGQPIDPRTLAWDSSGGPEIVAGYEVVQGWDGAEIGSTVTGLSVPLAARTGTAYAARVRALPVDTVAYDPSPWTTLAAEWPNILPQITSFSAVGRTTAPLPGGIMAISFVQVKEAVSSSTGTNVAVSFNATPGLNSTIVVFVVAYLPNFSQTAPTVSDNQGNSYTNPINSADFNSSGDSNYIFSYLAKAAASSGTFTVTVGFSTATYYSIVLLEYSGCDPTDWYDTAAANYSTTAQNAGSVAITPGNDAYARIAAYAHSGYDGTEVITKDANYTERAEEENSASYMPYNIQDLIAGTDNTANWTLSQNEAWAAVILTLIPATGGAAATALPRRALDGPFYGALRGSVR